MSGCAVRFHDLELRDAHNNLIRVVIAEDVVALPNQGWSGAGYGRLISEDWLLHSANPPLPRKGRKALAAVIAEALRLAADIDDAALAGGDR